MLIQIVNKENQFYYQTNYKAIKLFNYQNIDKNIKLYVLV